MPRRRSQGHRTEITVAIIAMISAVIVAFIANVDKIFADDPPPAHAQPQPAAPQPIAVPDGGTLDAAQRLSESQKQALDRYANSLDDITRQIDAQAGNGQ